MLRLPPRSSLRAITRLVTWRSGTWRPARSRRLATSPASSDGPQDAPDRPWPRRLQGQHRLRRVLRRVVYRPNIRKPQRPGADQRWFWALHSPSKPGTLRISNQVATLELAKAEFEASWKQWLAWAKLVEV